MKKTKSLTEQIKLLKKIGEQKSLRMGYKLSCYLYPLNNQNSLLDQRKKIRKQLTEEIEKSWPNTLSVEQKKKLLIPGTLAQVPFASLSISHSAFIGGFIISPGTQVSLGFDLERVERAKKRTALRISSKSEFYQSPSPSFLWSAKEAAYKSVHSFQKTISIKKISIFDWTPTEKKKLDVLKIYNYQFKVNNTNGKGFICSSDNIIIAMSFYTA